MIFYNKRDKCFHTSKDNSVDESLYVELTEEYHNELFLKQRDGLIIKEDEDGKPIAVEATIDENTRQQLDSYILNRRVSQFIDSKAREFRYDNILSCTKYISFDNQFKSECENLLRWNALVWEYVVSSNETDHDKLIASLPQYE